MRASMWLVAAGLAAGAVTSPAWGQGPSKPTPEHRALRKGVGTWDATVKAWMDPKGEPSESKGTEVNRMMPGGMWLLSDFKGEFGGQPFQGRGQSGYDPARKKYISTWIDSMSPGLMLMEGTFDEATKTLTMIGEMPDETGKPATFKQVLKHEGDDERHFTMYVKSERSGPDFVKLMEIHYKKRPKAAAGEAKAKAKKPD